MSELEMGRASQAAHASQDPLADLIDPSSSLRQVVDSLPMAVVGIDLELQVVSWNPAAERLFGYEAEDIIGAPYPLAPTKDQGSEALDLVARVRGGNPVRGQELTRTHKDGRRVDLALWSHVLRGHEGEPIGALGFMADLTKRKQIEREYRGLFENAHDAIVVMRPSDERVLDVNTRACEVYGFSREEFLGMSMRDVSVDPDLGDKQVVETLRTRVRHRFQTRHRTQAGKVLNFEINASVVEFGGEEAILSINRDVTDRARLENQARQAQKMEALGQMAGGVAHDFNNLLTALLGYPELIRKSLDRDHPARGYLEPMEEAAARAAEMTRHLLAFSRGQVVDMGPVEVDEALDQMRASLRKALPSGIRLACEFDAQGGTINGHRAELERIVLNLVHNASDAMPTGGVIRIQTRLAKTHEGRRYVLSVADDGQGMSEEVAAQVFEPFFTTKPLGKGTGLGLSTVYGIVKQHGGRIRVHSKPGDGTRFEISFPLLQVNEPSRDPATRKRTPSITEGEGVVLLVEDDEVVRVMAQQTLARAGYRVFAATNGQEAVAFIRGGAHLDLVLSDLLMPEMSGAELHQALQSLRPGLPILLMSGYAGSSEHDLPSDVQFLNKPFTPSELTARVAAILASGSFG